MVEPFWKPSPHEADVWLLVAGIYAATYVLNAVVAVRRLTAGYCIDPATRKPKQYRLNGFSVLMISLAAAAAAVKLGVASGDYLYVNYFAALRASFAIGMTLSALFYVRGRSLLRRGLIDRRSRCPTADAPEGGPASDTADFDSRSGLMHFYCGLSEFNPTGWGGVDVKMWLYLVGAVMLQLNLLSAFYAGTGGSLPAALANPGLLVYTLCLSFFVLEYCWQEENHLYTYDLFRERIGAKLAWGCACFYPFFYPIGAFPLLRHDAQPLTPSAAAACAALFFAGWALTRGANMQKFYCKLGRRTFMWGLIPMHTLPGSGGRLLVSGFWGVSRHINYAGEVTQALALSLPGVLASGSLLPLLYPAYYVALFIPRTLDDEAQCAAKYGPKLWGEYCRRVPWRIIPYVW